MENSPIAIEYCPYSYQEDIHSSDRRFKLIVGGRRVGKSQVALQEIIKHCISTPGALAWWIAPTYRDAKEIGWEEFIKHIEVLAPAIRFMHTTNLSVEFINGARLLFKGSDNFDSLRGRGLTFVVLDEAAFCHEDVWKKALRPALSDKKGRAILTSTPNGRNWYYDQFIYAGKEENKTWDAWKWPSNLNPLLTIEDLEAARDELSETDYKQEYLAEFVTKAGMIYSDFGTDNITSTFDLNPDRYDIFLGMDFGFANPTAIAFMAVDRADETVIQFDELYIERTPIQRISDKIKDILRGYNVSWQAIKAIYTDPAGNAEELSSGISPVDYLRSDGFPVINKGSNVAPGLALVRSFILNANGKRRYFIHERCKETIRSLYGYSYKLRLSQPTEEPDKDNLHDHACDAVRYFFVNRFDKAKYVATSLEQPSYVANQRKTTIIKRCAECRAIFPSNTPKNQPPLLCRSCLDAN